MREGVDVLNSVVASAGSFVANFVAAETEVPENDLNPIALELKELVWGFGAFVVFAVVLRYAIWPKLRSSIDARNQRVVDDHAEAEATTAGARGDVAEYEAQRAAARAEGQAVVEAARMQLEAERTERLTATNAAIAERRAAAMAEVEAAKQAARGDVEAAVASVATVAGQLATGRAPDPDVVRRAVESTVNAGVTT
jgi:F-type H+-transporting ATPase subunit b